MSEPYTEVAARRIAQVALLVENDQRGYDYGWITHPPRSVREEARLLVDDWFADRFGWPLTPRQQGLWEKFYARVLHHIEEAR